MFNTLDRSNEGRKRRGVSFICGLFVQVLLIGGAILLGVLFPDELQVAGKRYSVIWLPALLTPPEKPVVKPPREVARVVVPKLKPPEAPKLIAPAVAKLEVPQIRRTISSVHIPAPPSPLSPFDKPSPPVKAREQLVMHTGVFGGAAEPVTAKAQAAINTGRFGGGAEPVTTKRSMAQVQTGGFGSPEGFPGRARGDSPGNVPKLGSFGLPEGPGVGNGTGGRRGIQGVVASAGFGSGIAGGGRRDSGTGESQVATGAFENTRPAAQAPAENPHAPLPSEFQPLEILSKPSPVYTEDARRLRIQGEVALSVVFQANGEIRVIGVVRSLGHGLDQAAEQAAAQIRFKPAQRDGQPADFLATVRIEFRLA
jgi:TonB family protein